MVFHRKKCRHDGSPVVLSGVDAQLLVGGVVAYEGFHLLVVAIPIHDDNGSPLVSTMDSDGVVILDVLNGLTLLARDVGWRELGLLHNPRSGRPEGRGSIRLKTQLASSSFDSYDEMERRRFVRRWNES